jgi:hypothetical protein
MPYVSIVSFWEIMRQHNVWQLTSLIAHLKDLEFQGKVFDGQGQTTIPRELVEKAYQPLVQLVRKECERLELQPAIERCDKFTVALRDSSQWREAANQATVLREVIQSELQYRRFAFVTREKGEIWDKKASAWAAVWQKFPEAKEDSESAVDCYALEQNTACVFHLMRVAEFGLRALAKKLNVKLTDKKAPQPVEFATWEKVLNGIRGKLQAAHAMAKGERRKRKLQFYSDAADQCSYIRDLWRNEVAHTRTSYNDGEALGVMTRVRQFMELLAREV